MIRNLLQRLRDFFDQRRLGRAKERNKEAADNLDAVVKELLKK